MSVDPWPIPRLWTGQTCFVLGSGDSLTTRDIDRIRGAKVIAVNCACLLAPHADLLFFSDLKWFVQFRACVEQFDGLVVTVAHKAAEAMPYKVKYVSAEYHNGFPPRGSRFIREGNNSGQRAISVAHAMGARRIVLLGFDMQAIEGRTHFHDYYRNDPSRYPEHLLPAFRGWDADARASGVSIVNATPGSALTEFESVSLYDELPGLAA